MNHEELVKATLQNGPGMSRIMTEEQAYEKLCAGCEYEKRCHEDCTVCDAYLVAIGEAEHE